MDAGLSEEERAAKAGYAAALDSAYAAANPLSEDAQTKRVGTFMPVALDVDGDGLISTTPLTATQVGFNWDGLNFKKNTAWINANDAFLVLDRDFNQSVDNGAELLSNPLVADPAKGLRSLATWDANGDGRIDAADPIYRQLKVWQDFNQDGDNIQEAIFNTAAGPQTVTVQDEANVNGRNTLELNSLADWGITAIDYANNRYEFDSGLRNISAGNLLISAPNNGQGTSYGSLQTRTPEASNDAISLSSNSALYQIDLTDPAQRGRTLNAMMSSALERAALAALWEGKTAKLQADNEAVDAGLSEEERTAKAGRLAPLDTAYVATYSGDPNSELLPNQSANNKYYEFNSSLRRFYAGEVVETLMKRATTDQVWRGAA